uniref:LOW QUALITY PROTEIN: flap endonuclease GEN homolog 1-like n=1 Tax=Styela clava TaxID=7725 RepID=UPI00193A0F09|nr:LOW QUALITY PROTEIN: flap endonuclease GEN homolog 1-like [Styela clava]
MGVTKLWEVLRDVKQDVTLEQIKGQTLAVDLATWICESEGVKQMHSYVTRPYLRNLFFRVSSILRLDINLVFVLDGKAPELKRETISKRLGTSGSNSKISSGVRSRLNFKLKECCVLLDSLGVPWIKAEGEAEALCAALNKIGLVDGVITSDGDCFLYGARTVYKNFSVEKQVPFERYDMDDIEKNMSLDQRDLIALGLLLGCDYFPKGVTGVGTAQAMKLISSFQGKILFLSNSIISSKDDMYTTILGSFIQRGPKITGRKISRSDIIHEFSKTQKYTRIGQNGAIDPSDDSSLKEEFILKPPMLDVACKYLDQKLEWKISYSLEKVLPLATHFILNSNQEELKFEPEVSLKSIVKTRVKDRVQSLEVRWNLTKKVDLEIESEISLITLESEEKIRKVYPHIVDAFYKKVNQEKEDKKKMKAEARKLERKKQKGSPKKSKPPEANSSKMTDYFKAKKTRIERETDRLPQTSKSEKKSSGKEQGRTNVQDLELSLACLSLSKKANYKEKCEVRSICIMSESVDNSKKSSFELPNAKSVKEVNLPVIVFSSDSNSSDCELDTVIEQFRKTKLEKDCKTEKFELCKKQGAVKGSVHCKDLDPENKPSMHSITDITNTARGFECGAVCNNDITFGNELDFSLGCSFLNSPVASKINKGDNLICDSVQPSTSKDNLSPDKENAKNITPEKHRRSKFTVMEDSPVFMTLMQRIKSKKS